jgi:hypothetical protein
MLSGEHGWNVHASAGDRDPSRARRRRAARRPLAEREAIALGETPRSAPITSTRAGSRIGSRPTNEQKNRGTASAPSTQAGANRLGRSSKITGTPASPRGPQHGRQMNDVVAQAMSGQEDR